MLEGVGVPWDFEESKLGRYKEVSNMCEADLLDKKHYDLELLVSLWNIELQNFIAAWVEFTSILEDVARLTRHPILKKRMLGGSFSREN